MAVIETWLTQDLKEPVQVQHLCGSFFSHNGNANRIGVKVFDNGSAASLSGTVSGYAVIEDGTTVPCTGSLSGNQASVLIPAAAYVPGNVCVTIMLTSGTTVTTLAALVATVVEARTDTQVDPGSVVTDWTNTINAALQTVENYTGNIIATPYASLTYPVPLGKYCIYNNLLYRCVTPISSSENWTSSHWVQTKLSDDVSDLKSALEKYNAYNILLGINGTNVTEKGVTFTWNGSTSSVTISGKATGGNAYSKLFNNQSSFPTGVEAGKTYYLRLSGNTNSGMRVGFYNGSSTISAVTYTNDAVITVPANATGMYIRAAVQDGVTASDTMYYALLNALTNKNLMQKVEALETDVIDKEVEYAGVQETWGPTWYQGGIYTSNGQSYDSDNRIRTGTFLKVGYALKVVIPSGMEVFCVRYAAQSVDSFIGLAGDGFTTGDDTGTVVFKCPGEYVKLCAKYTDESDILPAAGSSVVITNYMPTDKSLSMQDKSADAKATRDLVNMLKGSISETSSDTLYFEQGTISATSHGKQSSSNRIRTKSYYLANIGFSFTVPEGFRAKVYYYEDEAYKTYVDEMPSFVTGNIDVEYPAGKYIKIVVRKEDGSEQITPSDITDPITITRYVSYEETKQDAVTAYGSDSWGISNVAANAEQIANTKWTPVGNMPKLDPGDVVGYFDIQQQSGMPYSSVRDQDKAIGMDVSIHTFMTAVRDPNSVLYTRLSTVSNSATYYGTVCSGLINYATGIKLNLTNTYLGASDLFETIPMISIQKGDVIWDTEGHIALIYKVVKDTYGRIESVTTLEEWKPLPRTVKYKSWEAFTDAREGYIARRFKEIAGVEYTPLPYIQCFDEVPPEEIIYPDVQTEFGDAAVFKVGENVKINVIDDSDYTTITVKLNGTTVMTKNVIEPFTISNVQAGLYTIIANGGANESVSTFFVVDCTGTFNANTGILTFSATNATPVLVNVYRLPENRVISCKPIILTDEDREAGQLDVSDYLTEEHRYAKVTFMTEYGTAVWYPEEHEKWIPIGS